MIYFGHFSFLSDASADGRGYLTCFAEAQSVDAALDEFRRLLWRLAAAGTILGGMAKVYLGACIEIGSIPRKGLLAHYCEELGEGQATISVSALGVAEKDATVYAQIEEPFGEGAGPAEPFLVLNR